jgi:hypothetical protein
MKSPDLPGTPISTLYCISGLDDRLDASVLVQLPFSLFGFIFKSHPSHVRREEIE